MLTPAEKAKIDEACEMAIELNNFKSKIYEYVESRMTFIAPNLSMIVGASTAAKLLGIAGGLTKLSKMPACNVQVLGSQKKTLSGFSQTQMLPHTGYVYYSQIVQDTAPDLRRKAARLVAAKSVLAARVDACHESVHGEIGLKFKEDIEKKLDKLQEPPPVKFIKPLPKPIEGSKKKRGGKRVRKMKERYALTEFRKQANRMNFGDVSKIEAKLGALKHLYTNFRLRRMPTKVIWAIHVAQLAKRVQVAFVCRNWMRRRRCASAKRCRRICKSSRSMEATPQLSVKSLAQRPAWRSHRCRVWR